MYNPSAAPHPYVTLFNNSFRPTLDGMVNKGMLSGQAANMCLTEGATISADFIRQIIGGYPNGINEFEFINHLESYISGLAARQAQQGRQWQQPANPGWNQPVSNGWGQQQQPSWGQPQQPVYNAGYGANVWGQQPQNFQQGNSWQSSNSFDRPNYPTNATSYASLASVQNQNPQSPQQQKEEDRPKASARDKKREGWIRPVERSIAHVGDLSTASTAATRYFGNAGFFKSTISPIQTFASLDAIKLFLGNFYKEELAVNKKCFILGKFKRLQIVNSPAAEIRAAQKRIGQAVTNKTSAVDLIVATIKVLESFAVATFNAVQKLLIDRINACFRAGLIDTEAYHITCTGAPAISNLKGALELTASDYRNAALSVYFSAPNFESRYNAIVRFVIVGFAERCVISSQSTDIIDVGDGFGNGTFLKDRVLCAKVEEEDAIIKEFESENCILVYEDNVIFTTMDSADTCVDTSVRNADTTRIVGQESSDVEFCLKESLCEIVPYTVVVMKSFEDDDRHIIKAGISVDSRIVTR
jgi:hypothetical protein